MNKEFYSQLAEQSLKGDILSREIALEILTSQDVELLPLLQSAYEVRKTFFGKAVRVHIINNGQNGFCPEDCHYCPQAKSSRADIEEYPLKSDEEFLAEAKNAYEKGAYRYCMVFAGRGPSRKRVEHLARLIRDIKSKYPIQICVSAGLLDQEKAQVLQEAGLDRLNHNLNTSEQNYPKICTTHTYADRINTLNAARSVGIKLCSGMILGMHETYEDVLEVVYKLREMQVESIPVNLLIPIEGNILTTTSELSPEYSLRVLALFRFLNPKSELRIAAGRELHLRSMEVLALYPANSLFLDGYLNTRGAERARTLQMIKDAGFTIESDHSLDDLIGQEEASQVVSKSLLKDLQDLRPQKSNSEATLSNCSRPS